MFTAITGVETEDGQLPYDCGQVLWLLQRRGVTSVSHVLFWLVQSTHAAPPEPQRESTKPAKHVFDWQQPGQFCVVHVVPQVPPWHVPPCWAQLVQTAPPRPHCVSVWLVTQTLPAQQPLAQLVELQVGWTLTHWPEP